MRLDVECQAHCHVEVGALEVVAAFEYVACSGVEYCIGLFLAHHHACNRADTVIVVLLLVVAFVESLEIADVEGAFCREMKGGTETY